MSLLKIAEEYKIAHNNFEFWTPYAINEPGVPEGSYRGKGRPIEIKTKLTEIIEAYTDPLNNDEEIRYLMLRNNLGIDCSGFVYYVLEKHLKNQDKKPLDHYLFASKTEIIEAFKKDSWQNNGKLTDKEIAEMPEHVQLSWVCERAQKDPIQITNVARLCSEQSTIGVDLNNIEPADLVQLKSIYGDHIWIFTDVSSTSISYAQSKFDPVGPGGISVVTIDRSDLSKIKGYQIEKICRLKVLA